ncbi:MAG: hypothetical protein SOW41_04820 [Anaerococcus sp.]|nr:hypothetical protein [Anaerococcus sp.]MDD7463358.1 hypothetical protein [Peptoniphilaceae bacterium]MDY3055371.1 hypothetical protein [Anaerococcus sp.]
MKKNQLVEIYSSSEDSFTVGYIIYEDKKRILVNSIDDQGRKDGYLLFKKSLIEKIERGTDYLEKIEKYRSFWGKTKLGTSDNPVFTEKPDFYDLIKYAHKYKKVITLATSFDYYDYSTGYVDYFDEDIVTIKALDQNTGELYEDFEIEIKDIILVEVENIDNLLLEYVNKK